MPGRVDPRGCGYFALPPKVFCVFFRAAMGKLAVILAVVAVSVVAIAAVVIVVFVVKPGPLGDKAEPTPVCVRLKLPSYFAYAFRFRRPPLHPPQHPPQPPH